MTCNHCGNQLPDGTAFCPNCGTRLLTTPRPNTAARLRQQNSLANNQSNVDAQLTQPLPLEEVRAAAAAQNAALNAGAATPVPQSIPQNEAPDSVRFGAGNHNRWKIFVLILLIAALLATGGYVGSRWWKNRSVNPADQSTDAVVVPSEDPSGKKEGNSLNENQPTVPQQRQSAEALLDATLTALKDGQSIGDWVDDALFVTYYRAAYLDQKSSEANIINYYHDLQSVATAYLQRDNRRIILPDGQSNFECFPWFEENPEPFDPQTLVPDVETTKKNIELYGVFEEASEISLSSEKAGESPASVLRITLVKANGEWYVLSILPIETETQLEDMLKEMIDAYGEADKNSSDNPNSIAVPDEFAATSDGLNP